MIKIDIRDDKIRDMFRNFIRCCTGLEKPHFIYAQFLDQFLAQSKKEEKPLPSASLSKFVLYRLSNFIVSIEKGHKYLF